MDRRAFIIGAPLVLAGCGSGVSVWAPDDVVNAAAFRTRGPRSLTLYTMRNNGSNNGAHSALLVDASQRVMFDPAGSFANPAIPERNDVLFGITPQIEDFYVSYHARETFHVVGQKVTVPDAVAEKALRLVLANGPVSQMNCTRATSTILGQLQGFESIGTTYFPGNLSDAFGKLDGVIETVYREDDADDKSIAAAQIDAAIKARQ